MNEYFHIKTTICSHIFIAFLTVLFNLIPYQTLATVSSHKLEIEFSFDSSSPGKEVKGYRLFASGKLVCEQAATEEAKPLICYIRIADGTYPFTLSVAFKDDTESAQSPPFLFTLDSKTVVDDSATDEITDVDDIVQSLGILSGKNNIDINTAVDNNADGKISLEDVLAALRKISG